MRNRPKRLEAFIFNWMVAQEANMQRLWIMFKIWMAAGSVSYRPFRKMIREGLYWETNVKVLEMHLHHVRHAVALALELDRKGHLVESDVYMGSGIANYMEGASAMLGKTWPPVKEAEKHPPSEFLEQHGWDLPREYETVNRSGPQQHGPVSLYDGDSSNPNEPDGPTSLT